MEALHRSPSPRPESGSSRRRGGFVFLHPLSPVHPPSESSANAPALAKPPPREPPSSCAGPFTLLSPFPAASLTPVCPLARHPSIDFVTNRGSVPSPPDITLADPREVRRSDTRRCVYMLIYKCIYCLYIFCHRRRMTTTSTEQLRIFRKHATTQRTAARLPYNRE